MAPEVAMGSPGVDARADVYGLGCVAYWLVTGRRVFDGATPLELALQHIQGQPVPPSKRTEIPLPEGLERIILDCLEKDPARRPATAEALGGQLAECALLNPWSPERARRWWETHMPGLGDSTAGARVGS
jgi:serine/threonine-protein kinase